MRYAIIYTNDRTVQGHRVYYLINGVNILVQVKVQMVTPTYYMQVSTAILYHSRGLVCLGANFIHMGIFRNFR